MVDNDVIHESSMSPAPPNNGVEEKAPTATETSLITAAFPQAGLHICISVISFGSAQADSWEESVSNLHVIGIL